MIMDELDWKPDVTDPGSGLRPVATGAATVSRIREIAPAIPTYMNMARSRRFGEFAPIADIASMDAYRVGAPKPDSWPQPWGGLLETAADYTEDLKRNCEPAPAWVWAQGSHTWDERLWVNNKLGRPCPTPGEVQSQLYYQLAQGAKGVFWFTASTPADARRYFGDKNNKDIAFRNLSDTEKKPLLDQISAWYEETLQSTGHFSLEMKALSRLLLRSDPARITTVLTASNRTKLDVAALVGEKAVLVFLNNADYVPDALGYRFQPQRNVKIRVSLPGWIKPKDCFWMTYNHIAPAIISLAGGTMSISTREIGVGAILVVATDSTVRADIKRILATSGQPRSRP